LNIKKDRTISVSLVSLNGKRPVSMRCEQSIIEILQHQEHSDNLLQQCNSKNWVWIFWITKIL